MIKSNFLSVPRLLMILAVAAAPADVINLTAGTESFRLTPFLILSLTAVAVNSSSAVLLESRITIGHLHAFARDHFLLGICVVLIFVSYLFKTRDPLSLSGGRVVLVAWLICFGTLLTLRKSLDTLNIFLHAVKLFLILQSLAVLTQIAMRVGIIHLPSDFLRVVQISSWTLYGSIVGTAWRLNGLVGDPNRAAVDIVLMLVVCYYASKSSTEKLEFGWCWYALGAILVLVTLSRTGIVALFVFFGGIVIEKRRRRWMFVTSLILAGLCITITPFLLDNLFATQIFTELIVRDNTESTRVHGALIYHGIEVLFSEIKNFVIGVGWGTGYVYTQQYFGFDRYGNFHSGIISMGVQAGIFALTLFSLYLIKPVLQIRWMVSAVIILLWINVFYQFDAEPMFWITVIILNSSYLWESEKGDAKMQAGQRETDESVSLLTN